MKALLVALLLGAVVVVMARWLPSAAQAPAAIARFPRGRSCRRAGALATSGNGPA